MLRLNAKPSYRYFQHSATLYNEEKTYIERLRMNSSSGKRHAVVVGISQYENAEIGDLKHTTKDARRLATVLKEFCDFSPENIHLFCDDDEGDCLAPTYSDILAQTNKIATQASADDLLLFFFAGHGGEISKEPYLLTNDTRMSIIQDTAIPVEKLNQYLENSRAKTILRFFDSCREFHSSTRTLMRHLKMSDEFSRSLLTHAAGSATFSSCSSGQVALEHDDLKQGVFSFYLCEGLSGKAADQEGNVTLDLLSNYLHTSVENWFAGKSGQQTPQIVSNLHGRVVLAKVPTRDTNTVVANDQISPLNSLTAFIDRHLAVTPRDIAKTTLATPKHGNEVRQLVFAEFVNLFSDLEFVDCEVTNSKQQLRQFSPLSWKRCFALAEEKKVRGEFTGEADSLSMALEFEKAALPTCSFATSVVRFELFYWFWFTVVWSTNGNPPGWQPKHTIATHYETVLPGAATDRVKVRGVLETGLRVFNETFQQWAIGLGDYLGERFAGIREDGLVD